MVEIRAVLFLERFWPSDDEEQDENTVVPHMRRIRRSDDPFLVYNERYFKGQYRLSKENIILLNTLLRPHLESRGKGQGASLSSMQQLLLCLHHLGSASFERDTGDCMQVSPCLTWKSINKVYVMII